MPALRVFHVNAPGPDQATNIASPGRLDGLAARNRSGTLFDRSGSLSDIWDEFHFRFSRFALSLD